MSEKTRDLGMFTFLLFVICTNGSAGAPASHPLPSPFSGFSEAEILTLVFPTYDRETGRQTEFPNQENRPALVRILEAKPWQARGSQNLVVFVMVATEDELIETVCGNCLTYGLLAVLRNDHGKLSLVARQETGPHDPASEHLEDGEVSGPSDAIWFSGHDEVKLDLAPYRLTREELLIGTRTEHIWIPAQSWSVGLKLFRLVGGSLKPVFEGPVVERDYPEGVTGPVVKTTAVLSSQPKDPFYDLVIERTTVRCPASKSEDSEWDCHPRNKGATRVGKQREVWSFNGEKYALKQEPK